MYTYKLNIESIMWEDQPIQKILKGASSLVFQSEGRIHPSVWDAIGVEFVFNHQESKYEFLRHFNGQEHLLLHLHNIFGSPHILSVDAISDLNEIAEREEFRRLYPKYFFSEILAVGRFIKPSKMYILIKDEYTILINDYMGDDEHQFYFETTQTSNILTGNAIVAASHASLSTWLRFVNHPSPMIRYRIKSWARNSFRKVVCKVSEDQFEHSKMCAFYNVITESSLDNAEVAIAFLPRHQYPEFFSGFHLYK